MSNIMGYFESPSTYPKIGRHLLTSRGGEANAIVLYYLLAAYLESSASHVAVQNFDDRYISEIWIL